MDLSARAAALLGITKSGLAQVVIRVHLAQAAATVRG
jgi:rare lipoprotein A (peptidoglycan hydrolase)